MTTHTPSSSFTAIATDELTTITGAGMSWDGVKDTLRSGFGLRGVYRGAVKGITSHIGGGKLAHEMYGANAPHEEVVRARTAFRSYLDASDRLPSWAPNW